MVEAAGSLGRSTYDTERDAKPAAETGEASTAGGRPGGQASHGSEAVAIWPRSQASPARKRLGSGSRVGM
jgi:hypothetical protein